jgi:hypothetical protein
MREITEQRLNEAERNFQMMSRMYDKLLDKHDTLIEELAMARKEIKALKAQVKWEAVDA